MLLVGELAPLPQVEELMHRDANGLSVTLFINLDTQTPFIRIDDVESGLNRSFAVPKESAMDAFEHPFIFLPMDYRDTA